MAVTVFASVVVIFDLNCWLAQFQLVWVHHPFSYVRVNVGFVGGVVSTHPVHPALDVYHALHVHFAYSSSGAVLHTV